MACVSPSREMVVEPVQNSLGESHNCTTESDQVSKSYVDLWIGGEIDIGEVDDVLHNVHDGLSACESIVGCNCFRSVEVIDLMKEE